MARISWLTKKYDLRLTLLLSFIIGFGSYFWLAPRLTHSLGGNDVLVVGMCAEYKPFEFKNENGGIQGFDVDLAQEIANRLGKKLAIKDIGFDGLLLSLENGDIDMIISAMSITNDRLKRIDMVAYHGEPLKELALVFWGKIPDEIKTFEDLATFKEKKGLYKKPIIAVQTGTVQANHLAKFSYVTPRTFDLTSEIVLDVQYRKSLAAYVRHDIALELQKQFPKCVKILDVPLAPQDWVLGDGIGIHKKNAQLTEQVELVVRDLQEEGFMTWLDRKWFGNKAAAA